MPDTRAICLDIETYGVCTHNHLGLPLPPQTVYHPRRSILQDRVRMEDLIQTCSITLVEGVPSDNVFDLASLAEIRPGQTMVLELHRARHRTILRKWLAWATTIFGKDLSFDLLYLRHLSEFRTFLSGSHLLIDLSVVNFLHSETRPERSLKNLGIVLRLFRYADHHYNSKEFHRFKSPSDPEEHRYNAEDTHNPPLAISELARRISRDYPSTLKLSPACLSFYSDMMWSCLRMVEAGIPFHLPSLTYLEEESLLTATHACDTLSEKHDLLIEGPGSSTLDLASRLIEKDLPPKHSRYDFFDRVFSTIDDLGTPLSKLGVESVYDSKILQTTDKKKLVSFKDVNRALARHLLPPDHEFIPSLDLWDSHSDAQGLVSRYTYPLLRHSRKNIAKCNSKILPQRRAKTIDPSIHLAYPTVYIVPSFVNDAQGDSGGQRQGRPSFKNPAAQTFPSEIKDCIRSRWRDGFIVYFDLAQIELRCAALLSGDHSLMTNYLEGRDLHADRAVFVFGPSITEHAHWKDEHHTRLDPRFWSKSLNFQDLYLAGAKEMQAQMLKRSRVLFPLSFFYKIVESRSSLRPGLMAWHQTLFNEVNTRGYLEIPIYGQTRTFVTGTAGNKPNEIVNFPVQNTASNVLVRLQHFFHTHLPSLSHPSPSCHLYLNVYDANYFDCKNRFTALSIVQMIEDAIAWITTADYWHLLENHYDRHVPLAHDTSIKEPA